MPIDDRQAKTLCTKDEYALYRASFKEDAARRDLGSRLRRARALRDKYRDLYRRQNRKARGTLQDPARTQAKADLFSETTARIEAAIAEQEKAERRGVPEPRGTPPMGARSAKSIYGAVPPRPGKAVKKVYTRNRSGHDRGETKRAQGKRDAR